MSGWKSLNRNQKACVEHFLNPKIRSVAAVAKASGLSKRTIFNYLADPDFKEALAERESTIINLATRKLISLIGLAIDTLESILKGDEEISDPTNQRLAAQAIINSLKDFQSLRQLISFEERLADLERELRQ